MATPDNGMLTLLLVKFLRRTQLTPDERREVRYIARGLASRDSAKIERVPVELIRTRRKHIFRKLGLSGSGELISRLLALSLTMLTRGERPKRLARAASGEPHRAQAQAPTVGSGPPRR